MDRKAALKQVLAKVNSLQEGYMPKSPKVRLWGDVYFYNYGLYTLTHETIEANGKKKTVVKTATPITVEQAVAVEPNENYDTPYIEIRLRKINEFLDRVPEIRKKVQENTEKMRSMIKVKVTKIETTKDVNQAKQKPATTTASAETGSAETDVIPF